MSLLQIIAISAVPVLFAITVHEVAHGFVALRCGDPTARNAGRLTLNPLAHIDYFGTLILPLILIATAGIAVGWAKPVPVDATYMRKPRRDMIWVALAGPGANALMVLFWVVVAHVGLTFGPTSTPGFVLFLAAEIGIIINIVILLFNLLPIPPLDGSVVLGNLLPRPWQEQWQRLFGSYGLLIAAGLIFLCLYLGVFTGPLVALIGFVHTGFGLPSGGF